MVTWTRPITSNMKIRRNKLAVFRLLCVCSSVILFSSVFLVKHKRTVGSFDILQFVEDSRITNSLAMEFRQSARKIQTTPILLGLLTTPRVPNSTVDQIDVNSSSRINPTERLSLDGNSTKLTQGGAVNEPAEQETLINIMEDPHEAKDMRKSAMEHPVQRRKPPGWKTYLNRNEFNRNAHKGLTKIGHSLTLNKTRTSRYVPKSKRVDHALKRTGPTSPSLVCLERVMGPPSRKYKLGDDSITNNLQKALVDTLLHSSNIDSVRFCKEVKSKLGNGTTSAGRLHRKEILERVVQILESMGHEQRLPDVLCIGVKKSGTNALEHFLKQHPLVRVPHDALELHYFDSHYSKGIEYYRSSLPFVNRSQLCLEKTPKYFVTDTAPGNIMRDISPSLKFVLCVRDPVKRTLSDWRHERVVELNRKHARRCVNCSPVGEGAKFTQRVFGSDGTVKASDAIIDTSNYARHFQNWLRVFPREQFLVVKEEDISTEPYRVLRKVEEFLALPRFFREDMFVFNERTKSTCFRRAPRSRQSCLPTYGPAVPKPAVGDAVIRKLRSFYRPHNEKFEELTGMNFSWSAL